ncbi:decapping endonuclease targeting mRNA [Dimargaris cristalligena]|uniref:Decapping nuclease n=1 Tax=Dimargaris cristalligena TaxID=215637 RepID=A0A4V1J4F3_9FUNG|nr:decapping endonuclease targeting mRNA [Dimargaris cristalligena]RKP35359.1 RAI1 like PD-XK nuclease-domain-containing protein [Dimargaris cristalligena]|eukprot:RKP35359.1 RAI1 like PD-XK nuclease-domain-containing protein [Dimargaris cristalligena]
MAAPVAQLDLEPPQRYQGRCPAFRQPTEIMSFSLDDNRDMHFDDRALNCYYPADMGTDLTKRYETFKARDMSINEHLDHLLAGLVHARQTNLQQLPSRPDFVTFRGIMTRIMYLPYNTREDWELGATRFNGTVYLEDHLTPARLRQQQDMNHHHRLLSYSGYRFETVSTVPVEPDQIRGPNDPILRERHDQDTNNMAEFNCIFQTKLGNHSIIMGAEVDCVSHGRHKEGRVGRYMELKTSAVINNDRQRHNFEANKLLKFYIQSFLAGIPKVVVGFRDHNNRLRELCYLKTLEIPRMVRQQQLWDPTVCLRFADQFLTWLGQVITEDDPNTSYTIKFQSSTRSVQVVYEGHQGGFLPSEFVQTFRSW